jgi:molybdate transport system substrate-binding protein
MMVIRAHLSELLALVAVLTAAFVTAAQGGGDPPQVVRVAAASDLRFALEDIGRALTGTQPGVVVQATYGSSGTLHAQILQRAPYDLFLSADIAYPEDLVARGAGAAADLFPYAIGRLVVWVPRSSPLPIERDGLLALSTARRVAIANPTHAPYGRAARTALQGVGLWQRLQPRLVLGENIAQAAQFVDSGSADAGIIARSLALAAPMRGHGRGVDIPQSAHPPLVQGGLILRAAPSRPAAIALRNYITSDAGRRLLVRHGFDLPLP